MFTFDPMYFLFIAPGMLLALWANFRVRSAYEEASRIAPRSGYAGAQAAEAVLHSAGVNGVRIEPTEGFLSDHYVPGEHVLRLSPDVYAGRSLAALGIAAHEAGHAIQDAYRYPLLAVRNGLVPLASVGSQVSMVLMVIGLLMSSVQMFLAGVAAFSMIVLFQVINLPVEFDASRRARAVLLESGLITVAEEPVVARVLNAAALTYVAATLSSVLQLLYFLHRAGAFSGNRRE